MDQIQQRKAHRSFIVLEGIDGSGTTTHVKLLQHHLARQGWSVHGTQEPSNGPIGALIRLALSRRIGVHSPDGAFAPLDEMTLALAFAADRADHLQSEILPSLDRGEVVICDRYYMSSLAYQSADVDYRWLRTLNANFLRPGLTIFLDVSPAVAQQRIMDDGRAAEIYENVERLTQVRAAYHRAIDALQSEGERIVVVNSEGQIGDVHAEIAALVERLFSEAEAKE
ncbi:MAG: dTMP kinase [Actinobacteria bacterium]|nr:dTMP kinase [Actinomycetota bacterium]